MKRFHVHVGVRNLDESVRFYSGLFGTGPAVLKTDYAKWILDDPRVNFAISERGAGLGVNHLGLQVDDASELPEVRERFAAADGAGVVDEPGVTCCYAKSDKHWVTDPQGVAWEGWHNLDAVEIYGQSGHDVTAVPTSARCCA